MWPPLTHHPRTLPATEVPGRQLPPRVSVTPSGGSTETSVQQDTVDYSVRSTTTPGRPEPDPPTECRRPGTIGQMSLSSLGEARNKGVDILSLLSLTGSAECPYTLGVVLLGFHRRAFRGWCPMLRSETRRSCKRRRARTSVTPTLVLTGSPPTRVTDFCPSPLQ